MAPKVIRYKKQRQQRQQLRQRLGQLANLLIQQGTLKRYERAVHTFFRWCEGDQYKVNSEERLAARLSEWIEDLWEQGEGRSVAGDGISGILHFLPEMQGKLKRAYRLFTAWKKHELPARAPPLVIWMVEGMAYSLVMQGNLRLALIFLLGFDVFLRTGELLELRKRDFAFGPRSASCVISLGFTKSGHRRGVQESVVCRSPHLVAFAKLVLEKLQPGDYIVVGGGKAFRAAFDLALRTHGLENHGFRPYSLRRGGATAAFRDGATWEQIADTGRWTATRTLRIYVADAAAELESFATPRAVVAKLQTSARKLRAILC